MVAEMAPSVQLIWGCDPERQFEQAWLLNLLEPLDVRAFRDDVTSAVSSETPRVLVETGLLRLERQLDPNRLALQQQQRQHRLEHMARHGSFVLVHLSDEEGLDGDLLYPQLPDGTTVWRNFSYPRFDHHPRVLIRNFPIGPRREFLANETSPLASQRSFPWAFMGTLWRSGERLLATSLFLRKLPQGQFFGGRHFGVGLPLAEYRQRLQDSVFALCPEGDRHFDTFRLYESLQVGCLPLVVERQQQAVTLLGRDFPLPIFPSWAAALAVVEAQLKDPHRLDQLQRQVSEWWVSRKADLGLRLRQDLKEAH